MQITIVSCRFRENAPERASYALLRTPKLELRPYFRVSWAPRALVAYFTEAALRKIALMNSSSPPRTIGTLVRCPLPASLQ
jgi:hypothetical protein